MSDRIKKIKVKKADGSMTDYIPIGADAQNIDLDHNGSNVEDTLKKKPYYYNNVANMKADNTLKVGDMAITLGYYEANDGGSGLYKIRNAINSDVVDGRLLISLTNENLVAELIVKNNTVNFLQLGLINNTYVNENFTISNLSIDMLNKTLNYKTASFINCKLKNGTIICNNDNTISLTRNITLENISIINNNNTGDTRNNMMNTDIDNSDTVIIKNCTFKNYGFHFRDVRQIVIKNNLFYGTLPNSYSIVLSKEPIHVINKNMVLENCNIENNVFKNFENDCIDLYPHGNNTSIKNNTFYNCTKSIEIKAENRDASMHDRTINPIHSCVVQGNYIRDIPTNTENAVGITIYCNDDTETNNYTLYPHIVLDSNFFCNDLGTEYYKAIRLSNINNITISNCRTNKRDNNVYERGQFIYSLNSNAIINNCITTLALTSDPNKFSIFHISNCIGGNVGGAKSLVINNSQVENITSIDNPNVQFIISNVICPTNNFNYKGGLGIISNSIFRSFNNSFTEDSTTTQNNMVSIDNCFYTTQKANDTANFKTTNTYKISSSNVKYITEFN